ncbi:hypothetical protein GH714_029093 [Hevea brasiliensis]|uniref:Uncharacterized protein n=1 Tax=Hevea brasiliensis TaxID=3981 RepID=A0A6A6KLE9_HEVBR|nr:hypothetical protein GH714_029093 [Hevea brasiliensis]
MAIAITKKLLANAILLLCLAKASCEAKGLPGAIIKHSPHPGRRRDPTEKIFNVLHFGAKTDPRKDNALPFIQAWNAACNWRGKARVLVPRGDFVASSMVFGGPCQSTAPILFQLVGNLKALSDLSSYAEDFWMIFQNINGLVVAGTGTFDGQGPNVWKYNDHKGSVFPAKYPLTAPEESPNTDGVHISQSNQVVIARSVIATGDDCVGMIHGSTDITIKKITCGPGHGISIGSLGKYPDEKDVKGILVTNCTLTKTENGIRIKTWAGSPPSQATALTFRDIVMDEVRNPIIIDQSYGSKSNAPSKVQISDAKFMNIRGTTTSEVGVNLGCSKQVPCQEFIWKTSN